MKKIQLFVNKFGYGSLETQVLTLATSLVELYKIEIICVTCERDIKLHKNISLTTIEKGNFVINKINELKFFKKLNDKVNEFNADIIIVNDPMYIKYLDKLNMANKKMIYWVHHTIKDKKDLEKLKKYNYVVTSTNRLKDSMANTLENVVTIPNAVSLDLKKTTYNKDSNKLVTISKLELNEQFIKIFTIMELLAKRKKNVVLNIIGDGKDRNEIANIIKEKGLNRNIHLFGFYTTEDLNEELVDSEIYLSTNVDDIFELAVLEAMSIGLPVVAFDNDFSIREIITDDIDGYLINENDFEKMVDAIIELLEHPKKREDIGNCAIEKCLGYNINVIKIEWIKLFN